MEIQLNKTTLTLIGVCVVLIILLFYRGCNKGNQLQEQIDLYEASKATLLVAENKLGQQTAQIELMTADNEKDLLKMQTQDSTIMKLQSVVKDYKGKLATATVIINSTGDVGSTATTITKHDTVTVNGVEYIYGTYESEWDEEWSSGKIVATKDSISRNFLVKNEYEITQGWERQGFLKGKSPVVKIKNLNPNTSTEELRSFTVTEKKKPFALSAGAVYGIDILHLRPTIVVGVGVTYSIIKF